MRLYRHDDPQHVQTSELLPWFVNGTLDPEEHTRVERHLADCISCKQELARLRAEGILTDEEFGAAKRHLLER